MLARRVDDYITGVSATAPDVIRGGALAVGERLPGPGRNVYARIQWEW